MKTGSTRHAARVTDGADVLAPRPGASAPHARERRPAALAALCVTQITSWGVLYYAFPVALASVTADTGWTSTQATAAYSTGLVVSALAGVPTGRLLDEHGPRRVMTAGSVLATFATLGIALAPTLPWFFAAWVVAGVAMSAVFYQPAFAALTRWYGPQRVRALTTLTLVAGLSSTIFAPATDALLGSLGWRATYLVLAGVLAVVTVPLHALYLRPAWARAPSSSPGTPSPGTPPGDGVTVRSVVRSRGFLVLSASLTLASFSLYGASLTLIPLLVGRGLSHSLAALCLGLLGAGQLLGRLGYGWLAARTGPVARAVVLNAAGAAAVAVLAVLSGPPALLVVASVALGAARGAGTLLQATVVADRWGVANYASLAGVFAAPITLAVALSPWTATTLAHATGSYPVMFGLLVALALLSAATAALAGPEPHPPAPGSGRRPTPTVPG